MTQIFYSHKISFNEIMFVFTLRLLIRLLHTSISRISLLLHVDFSLLSPPLPDDSSWSTDQDKTQTGRQGCQDVRQACGDLDPVAAVELIGEQKGGRAGVVGCSTKGFGVFIEKSKSW